MAVPPPPPELEVQTASETDEPTKPANISDSYWQVLSLLFYYYYCIIVHIQRFQQLKTRRQKQHKKSSKRRAEKLKQSALKAGTYHKPRPLVIDNTSQYDNMSLYKILKMYWTMKGLQ